MMDDRKHGEADLGDCVASKQMLIDTGYVDPERIGIIGGSYGGYMVLAALAFTPEEFTVGVDIFGVHAFARPVGCRRDGDIHDDVAGLQQLQALFVDADLDERGFGLHAGIIPVMNRVGADRIRDWVLTVLRGCDPLLHRVQCFLVTFIRAS